MLLKLCGFRPPTRQAGHISDEAARHLAALLEPISLLPFPDSEFLSLSSLLTPRASTVQRHKNVTAAQPLLSFFSYRSKHLSHFSEIYSSLGTFSAMLGVVTASCVI